jgi:hypothetical protein
MEGFETASEAGGMLAGIVMSEPGWLGKAATQIVYPPIGDFMPRSKDVLPLPLPADVSDFLRICFKRQSVRGHGGQTVRKERDTGVLGRCAGELTLEGVALPAFRPRRWTGLGSFAGHFSIGLLLPCGGRGTNE